MKSNPINTGVQWLPSIPSTWQLTRVNKLFYLAKDKVSDPNPTVLSLARDGVKVRDISNNEGQLAESYDNYSRVIPGDLLLNPMDLQSGANCNMSEISGIISPAYMKLRALNDDVNPKFFDYYFKFQYWTMAMFAHGKGVSFDHRWTLNADTLLHYEVPFPPREEQDAIVDELKRTLGLADNLINNQEKQIEKLKEYRQAIITKAVTKGLDPNVPMKNSGVKWIGSIPKFWSVARIKDLVTYNEHQLSEKSNPEQTIEYIDIGSVSLEYGIEQTQSFAFKDAPSRARRITERNDVIISTVRTYLKAIAKIEKDGLIASTGFCVLHPTKVDPNYLSYFCKSAAFCDFITANSYGISYPAIDAEQLVNAYISLPSPNEQKQIVQYIDKKCMLIDKLIDIKDRTRKQLLDFKKSLIYEYVTGKRRVSL
ncbi:MAG: restriction endonuclease subunit S [Mollicutes bacterium]|nr:restriction endonuclease subunit S [Mollicutes bacterium]